jgi:uncharacterized protein YndB with AHSA1/START domain
MTEANKTAIPERDFGILERTGDGVTIRYERQLPHAVAKVWRAITEGEHLERWFPTTLEGERRAGAALTFRHDDLDLPVMHGEMLAFEPEKLMELRWDDELLHFELHPQDGGKGCLLILTASFEEVGKAARDGAGWHACLDQLAEHMIGVTSELTPGSRWSVIHRHYVERFPAEASTIGPPQEWEHQHGADPAG